MLMHLQIDAMLFLKALEQIVFPQMIERPIWVDFLDKAMLHEMFFWIRIAQGLGLLELGSVSYQLITTRLFWNFLSPPGI